MMDYWNGVHGFINYAISNLRNISGGDIKCPCKRCKNASSAKRIHGEMSVLVCTRRTIYSSRYHDREDGWVNF